MTDDKEERIYLELTVAEYQELIEGYTGNSEGVYEKLKNAVPSIAPKHTAKEYDKLIEFNHIAHKLKDERIKELEAELAKAKADSHEAWKHRGFHDSEAVRK